MKTVSIHAHPRYKFIVKFLVESDSRVSGEEARAIQRWEGYPPDTCGHWGLDLIDKRLDDNDRPRYVYTWSCQARAGYPAPPAGVRKTWGEL